MLNSTNREDVLPQSPWRPWVSREVIGVPRELMVVKATHRRELPSDAERQSRERSSGRLNAGAVVMMGLANSLTVAVIGVVLAGCRLPGRLQVGAAGCELRVFVALFCTSRREVAEVQIISKQLQHTGAKVHCPEHAPPHAAWACPAKRRLPCPANARAQCSRSTASHGLCPISVRAGIYYQHERQKQW